MEGSLSYTMALVVAWLLTRKGNQDCEVGGSLDDNLTGCYGEVRGSCKRKEKRMGQKKKVPFMIVGICDINSGED
ncbi:hypothetical protein F4775DRAFT_570894 [Biscogniauxia sp. FL1348]|nr:hypothetical protein F4775DRAFT_570894 [Biscogniauxia sp. FL1348]